MHERLGQISRGTFYSDNYKFQFSFWLSAEVQYLDLHICIHFIAES